MSFGKEDLGLESIHDIRSDPESNSKIKVTQNSIQSSTDHKMPPAAISENSGIDRIALKQERPNAALAAIAAAFKTPRVQAQALMEEHQQRQNGTEGEILALLRAHQFEALKEKELRVARAIRRLREEDQVRKEVFSNYCESGSIQWDPRLMNITGSSLDGACLGLEVSSRKRRLEEAMLTRSILQQQQQQSTLLNDVRKVTRRGNEDGRLHSLNLSSRENMTSNGASSRISSDVLPVMNSYGNSFLPLPSSSGPSLSPSLTPSSSSRPLTILEAPAPTFSGRMDPSSSSQFHISGFRNDRSSTSLNSLYPLTPGPVPTNQDFSSFSKYYNALNASRLSGRGNTNNGHIANVATASTHIPNIRRTEARIDWLRTSNTGGSVANASFESGSSQQQDQKDREGRIELFVGSQRMKTAPGFIAANDGDCLEQEAEQQQKRFNKHQCKQWTLRFQELLSYKAKEGHCNVPHGYKDNLGLAMWVKRQRHQYNLLVDNKTSTLTDERIKLLENIGFVWNCLESAWEQHYQDLRDFMIRNGHCAVPSTYEVNPKLASWVVTQRRYDGYCTMGL
mmetsp:Transcript_14286/g.32889  ORF Transcript_14286/g.32889 Transcript_14286/m.32889 type:complete len:566 (-) Transcript_14286:737-2434(-)